MSENLRLILAFALSMLIIATWQKYFVTPMVEDNMQNDFPTGMLSPSQERIEVQDRKEMIAKGLEDNTRKRFANQFIKGSINLKGARIDDVTLLKYKITTENNENNENNIILFSPSGTKLVYFAEFGWLTDGDIELPNGNTIWSFSEYSRNNKLLLYWINKDNIRFEIAITLQQDYMFNIVQTVINNSTQDIKLRNYSLLSRNHIVDETATNMIVHEGAIGVFDNNLKEITFDNIEDEKFSTSKGWFGFSDKYWLSAIVSDKYFSTRFSKFLSAQEEHFQADSYSNNILVNPGSSISQKSLLFSGAKQLDLLDKYQAQYNIPLFDRSVDFGILYFITKPILLLLQWFYNYLGNFGIAILMLTLFIKILLLPLAYKGFKGMNKLKELQPKMAKLKEKYSDDSAGLQQELMKLYKKEKVNPVAGCLPLLLQLPVFFALYKVLYVSIEMRHAHFFGWINDLSAADNTSIFNLFGLMPWNVPSFLMIGVFPIAMAITMFLQQKMNPAPTDPVQAKVMQFLPLIFLFMFASFPVGLLVYWTWSNILSIIQQYSIKRFS